MSSLNISLSLRKLPLLIEEAQDLIDEKIRLNELDDPLDNDDINASLQSIVKLFNYIDSELAYNLKEFLKHKPVLSQHLEAYRKLLDTIESYNDELHVHVKNYEIGSLKCFEQEKEQLARTKKNNNEVIKTKKSVRFKDSLIDPPSSSSFLVADEEDDDLNKLKQNLFQTSTPYFDDEERASLNTNEDFSNRQLFINNQQEILQQDSMLSSLSGSIRTQRDMGLSINEELDDHLIILNDLEMMIDGTGAKLERGMKRVERFNSKLKENGSWVTILVLLVILIFLVVVV